MNKGIKMAARLLGNQSRLAKHLHVSRQVVSLWALGKERVPLYRAMQISELTKIPLKELRPEFFHGD